MKFAGRTGLGISYPPGRQRSVPGEWGGCSSAHHWMSPDWQSEYKGSDGSQRLRLEVLGPSASLRNNGVT